MDSIVGTLITGANGFLGRHLQNVFLNSHTLGQRNCTYNLNISLDVPELLTRYKTVIHAAGKAHSIPRNDKEIKAFFDVNVVGTKNLLFCIETSGSIPNSFVFISTVAVYGKYKGKIINENSPLLANDPYGLSKIQAERLVQEWCNQHNVVCTIIRLPLLVGENPPGNLGAMIKGIQKGYYFNIAGGKAKKSMVLAQDVAKFIPIIAPIGGIYNLTDGEHPTFVALSAAIAKNKTPNLPLFVAKVFGFIGDIIGNKFPINSLKIKKITSDLTFDDSKARAMGWKPESVLEYLKFNKL
jgi:nucleoside-diphosphate-sugar epimerase